MPVAYTSLNNVITAVHHLLCDVVQGETLFRTMIEVTGGGGAAGASGGSSEAAVRTALEDYMARLPQPLEMVEVRPQSRVLEQTKTSKAEEGLCDWSPLSKCRASRNNSLTGYMHDLHYDTSSSACLLHQQLCLHICRQAKSLTSKTLTSP